MHKGLINAGVNFPDYWDEVKVLKALTTLDTYDLYAYFGCSNATSFTRLMKTCFPNRPDRTSYSAYVRGIVSVFEPKSDLSYEELYELDGLSQMKYINARPEFNKKEWHSFKSEYNSHE